VQRVALGVHDRLDSDRLQLGDDPGAELGRDRRRGRPGDDADPRPARQVEQLLEKAIELLRRDLGPALVDLGLLAGGRIDDGDVGPRLAADPGEVSEYRLLCEPVGPPASPVAITGRPSSFKARATLTPLPPATVLASTERWRRP
jgi:hypothetical protein